jgi:hypothetical protein
VDSLGRGRTYIIWCVIEVRHMFLELIINLISSESSCMLEQTSGWPSICVQVDEDVMIIATLL